MEDREIYCIQNGLAPNIKECLAERHAVLYGTPSLKIRLRGAPFLLLLLPLNHTSLSLKSRRIKPPTLNPTLLSRKKNKPNIIKSSIILIDSNFN